MWHVHHDELVQAGFHMIALEPLAEQDISTSPTDGQLHINILEFFAVIISTWFCLWHIHTFEPNKVGGHILSILGDNTSALSWLRHSTQSRTPMVRCLSRLLVFILTKSAFPGRIIGGSCIKGKTNNEADCLSRPISRAPHGTPLPRNAPT